MHGIIQLLVGSLALTWLTIALGEIVSLIEERIDDGNWTWRKK